MTETLTGMTSMPKDASKTAEPGAMERAAVRELVKAARARGEDLTGPDGRLKTVTATGLEAALEEQGPPLAVEMSEHLGREKTPRPGRWRGHRPQWDPVQDGSDRRGREGGD